MKVVKNTLTGRETLRIADTEGDVLEVESFPETISSSGVRHEPLLSLTMGDDEGDDVCCIFSQRQIRELLPHLAAFSETGRLEESHAE